MRVITFRMRTQIGFENPQMRRIASISLGSDRENGEMQFGFGRLELCFFGGKRGFLALL